jgi:glycogen operon protein
VYSANATNVVLEIYTADTGSDAQYDYAMTKGPDNVWRAAVAGAPAYTLYAFRAWGPNWPLDSAWARGNSSAGFGTDCDSKGNRFNPNKVLFDPYARELSHNTWTPAMQAAGEDYAMYTSGGTNISSSQTYKGPLSGGAAVDCRTVDTGRWAPKAVAFEDATPTGPKPNLAEKDAVIYEAHLKGLTAHPSSVNLTSLLSAFSGFQDAANVPDGLRGTYAGAAYMAGYLKDLGFTTLELLPVQETDNAADSTTGPTTSGGGYWCYFTYGFFAPDRRYASNQSPGGPTAEFRAMVAAFHRAGIEVYLDVVYNHSGEGGVWDTATAQQAELTFLRGLDNASYYTLVSRSPQSYWVSTGVAGAGGDSGVALVEVYEVE